MGGNCWWLEGGLEYGTMEDKDTKQNCDIRLEIMQGQTAHKGESAKKEHTDQQYALPFLQWSYGR